MFEGLRFGGGAGAGVCDAGGVTDDDSALEVQVRAKRVSKLAAAGHEAAVATYGALARYLAEGVANLANVLDPEAVILSGGVVEEKWDLRLRFRRMCSNAALRKAATAACAHGGSGSCGWSQGAAATVFDGLN